MSELPLPAEIARWPENPFELLGTTPSADAITLKRAYQRLIKIYRPEQHPDEFRRIREAYEAAQSIGELMSSLGAEAESTPPASLDAPIDLDLPEGLELTSAFGQTSESHTPQVESGAPPGGSEFGDSANRQPPQLFDAGPAPAPAEPNYAARIADAWNAAKQGDLASAYRDVDQLRAETPGRHEAYLALYWLLRMAPKLDAAKHCCDWLTACMEHAEKSRGAALELYRREVQRRPAEALTDRCTRLLRETLVEGPAFLVADWRWQAAVRERQWSLLRDDIDVLRRSPLAFNHEAWIRLLWSAVECVCWSNEEGAQTIARSCVQELEQLGSAHESQYDAMTQLDFLMEVAAAVRLLRAEGFSALFCDLIQNSWASHTLDLYCMFCTFAAPLVANPEQLLKLLTTLGQKAPPALGRFGQVVQLIEKETEREVETFWKPETARPVVIDFLDFTPRRFYELDLRPLLLKFCLYEQITPEQVAACIADDDRYDSADGLHLSVVIMQDVPLQTAYQALRLFAS